MSKTTYFSSLTRLAGILAVVLAVQIAPAEEKIERDAKGERIWDFTGYIKGTRFQIRDTLNGEVVRLTAKIKETTVGIAEENKEIETDSEVARKRVRKTPEYLQAKADMEAGKAALDAAHAAHDTSAALTAGSQYNKARTALADMERRAISSYDAIEQDRTRLAKLKRDLDRLNGAFQKAQKWRGELLEVIRNTYMLRWPLRAGDEGVMDEAVMVQTVEDGTALVVYEALQPMSAKDQGEGIARVEYRVHRVPVLLSGIDTKSMKTDKINHIGRNVEIVKETFSERLGPVYIARLKHSDLDDLLGTVLPDP